MTKHTQGPWHWVNSQTDEPFDFDAEWDGYGRPSLRTVAETKKSTFSLPEWILDAEPMQHGNDVANARLIAAAPELLEALKRIEARVSYYAGLAEGQAPNIEQWAYTDASGDMAIVRAAIAKAEGANT